ncbi:hypothetical protein WA026_004088, partial [Henosepilachna vigintioctopunctata]
MSSNILFDLEARTRSPIYVSSSDIFSFEISPDAVASADGSAHGEIPDEGSSIATRTPSREQVEPPSAASRRPPLLPAKGSDHSKKNMSR